MLFDRLLMFQAMGFVCAMLVLVKSGKLTLHGDACIADYPNTMLFFFFVRQGIRLKLEDTLIAQVRPLRV